MNDFDRNFYDYVWVKKFKRSVIALWLGIVVVLLIGLLMKDCGNNTVLNVVYVFAVVAAAVMCLGTVCALYLLVIRLIAPVQHCKGVDGERLHRKFLVSKEFKISEQQKYDVQYVHMLLSRVVIDTRPHGM